jgi:branched-chain amino acid transport system permease protein
MDSVILSLILNVVAFISIYGILSITLNLQYGYSGIPNFGMTAFVALGAYVTGALTGRLAMIYYGIDSNLDYIADNTKIITLLNSKIALDPLGGILLFIITIILSILFSIPLAYAASYPAIRLREDYLIITLIGIGEAMRIVGVNYTPLVGGTLWVGVPNLFKWAEPYDMIILVSLMLIIMFLIYLFIEILTSSPFGRLIKAVRENETTARFIGKDVTKIRILVLLIGSSLASIAGVLYSLFMGAVMASAFTRSDWTYWPWLMLIIGGKGNNIGALVGAVIIVIARQLIAIYKHDLELFLPFSVVWLEQMLLGITLIAFMIYRPIGIIPEKPVKIRGISFKKIKQEIEI